MKTLLEFIRKHGSGYRVVSHSGKNLGDTDSKAAAVKRLKQVEYFKHHKEDSMADLPVGMDPKRRIVDEAWDTDMSSWKKAYTEAASDDAIIVDPKAQPVKECPQDTVNGIDKDATKSSFLPSFKRYNECSGSNPVMMGLTRKEGNDVVPQAANNNEGPGAKPTGKKLSFGEENHGDFDHDRLVSVAMVHWSHAGPYHNPGKFRAGFIDAAEGERYAVSSDSSYVAGWKAGKDYRLGKRVPEPIED
jgi:hypothetical protein